MKPKKKIKRKRPPRAAAVSLSITPPAIDHSTDWNDPRVRETLVVACRLMAEHLHQGVTAADIAKQIGCSTSTALRPFTSFEHLLEEAQLFALHSHVAGLVRLAEIIAERKRKSDPHGGCHSVVRHDRDCIILRGHSTGLVHPRSLAILSHPVSSIVVSYHARAMRELGDDSRDPPLFLSTASELLGRSVWGSKGLKT